MAMFNLGLLEKELGHRRKACQLWTQAENSGTPNISAAARRELRLLQEEADRANDREERVRRRVDRGY
jgi:hypothetical protein